MDAKRWGQIKEVYDRALDLRGDEREGVLAEACGGDADLRREVESLLAAHDDAGTFLQSPAVEVAARKIVANEACPPATQLIGRELANYKIISLLGRGGMGEVYLAEDKRLRRKVALKLLPVQFTNDTERVRRFEREAAAASAINHPNIVTIHEIGQIEQIHYLVTELVAGETLRQRLTQGRVEVMAALEVGAQVASALEVAHEAGIIHRDIKPENVMVRPDGLVKVLDFGLAKLTERPAGMDDSQAEMLARSDSASGLVMGTPQYMSPEQARGQNVGSQTDIFSLGVMLYEMVAGHKPFGGETVNDVIAAILKTEPQPLTEARPDAPAELQRIVSKALAKERSERYQSINDLELDLQNLKRKLESKDEQAVTPEETSRDRSLTLNARRSRAVRLAVPSLLIAAVVGLLTWLAYHYLPSRGDFESEVLPNLKTELIADWKTEPESNLLLLRVSPDEKHIAFSKREGGQSDIFVKPIGEGEATRITNDRWIDYGPIWSPDGQQIIYLSSRNDQLEVWQVPQTGGAGKRIALLPNSLTQNRARLLRWSRAGRMVYFLTNCNIYTLDLENGAFNQLTKFNQSICNIFSADISEDEQWVTYDEKSNEIMHIFAMPLNGSAPLQLSHEGEANDSPFWHPDGQRIIYRSTRNGAQQICVAYLDGRPPRQLTFGHERLTPLDVSSDRGRIIYSTDNDDADLFRFDLLTGEETRISSGRKLELSPNVSPNGHAVVYQQADDTTNALQSAIWAKPLQSEAKPTRLATDAFDPRWSPDGGLLAFLRLQNGQASLWTIHADGTNEQPMVKEGVWYGGHYPMPFQWKYTSNYSWAPNGRRLAYISFRTGTYNIWTTTSLGMEERKVSANDDPAFRIVCPIFAPDNRRIACLAFRSTSGKSDYRVWIADEGQQRTVFQTAGSLRLLGWSPTAEHVFVTSVEDVNSGKIADVKLLRLSVSTGAASLVAKLPSAYVSSFRLAPNNNQVTYFLRRQDHDELWHISLADGRAKKIIASNDSLIYFAEAAWAPDAHAIYFSKQSNAISLWAIDHFR
jgi:serine/threonine protein kinase